MRCSRVGASGRSGGEGKICVVGWVCVKGFCGYAFGKGFFWGILLEFVWSG